MTRIGVQAYTIRSEFPKYGPYETLRKVADIGFHTVEMSQVPMTAENVKEMQRAQDDFGIDICALSAPLDPSSSRAEESISQGMDKILADCKALGAPFVRIGMAPMPALRNRETLVEFSRRCDEAAARMADDGVTLCYHNHHIEFARHDGQYLLDIIRENAPHLRFEIDLHWVHRGGADPLRTLETYSGVVDLVHLKDYRIALPSEEAFDAYEAGDMETWQKAFSDIVQFAEVGEGGLDFPALIEQSKQSGAAHLLIEQDATYQRTPFEALELSYKNLVGMGYQDLI